MVVDEMVVNGLKLMLLGMGVVSFFLGILILVVIVMSRLAKLVEGNPVGESREIGSPPGAQSLLAEGVPPRLTSVISAAIYRYRKDNS